MSNPFKTFLCLTTTTKSNTPYPPTRPVKKISASPSKVMMATRILACRLQRATNHQEHICRKWWFWEKTRMARRLRTSVTWHSIATRKMRNKISGTISVNKSRRNRSGVSWRKARLSGRPTIDARNLMGFMLQRLSSLLDHRLESRSITRRLSASVIAFKQRKSSLCSLAS